MKLICEKINPDVKLISEVNGGEKQYYIEGIFAQADVVNGNNRIYPSEILFPEVNRYINEKVKTGTATGELDHPETPTINLDRVSHLITDLRIEGKNVIGRARLLDTEKGIIAKKLLAGGVRLGVSTRGLASTYTRNDGVTIVENDFQLMAVDIVGNPSAPEAFVNGILESVTWKKENGIFKKDLTHQKRLDAFLKIINRL